jgi:hypothetical protein
MIGLIATVTRAQETRKTELGLKRNNYRKICVIKEIKDIQKRISLIIINSYYICIYKDEVELSPNFIYNCLGINYTS